MSLHDIDTTDGNYINPCSPPLASDDNSGILKYLSWKNSIQESCGTLVLKSTSWSSGALSREGRKACSRQKQRAACPPHPPPPLPSLPARSDKSPHQKCWHLIFPNCQVWNQTSISTSGCRLSHSLLAPPHSYPVPPEQDPLLSASRDPEIIECNAALCNSAIV